MTRIIPTFLFILIAVTARTAVADIIWNYESTDGNDVVTGQIVTSGDPGDEFADSQSFDLVSITNTFLNGVEITNWLYGQPPFAGNVSGQVRTIGALGQAVVHPSFSRLSANNAGPQVDPDEIYLGRPGSGQTLAFSVAIIAGPPTHYNFFPTSTTFATTTVVPETRISLVSAFFAIVILARRKVR